MLKDPYPIPESPSLLRLRHTGLSRAELFDRRSRRPHEKAANREKENCCYRQHCRLPASRGVRKLNSQEEKQPKQRYE